MKKDDPRRLWKVLLKATYDEAAAGLLCDLFRYLRYTTDSWPSDAESNFREISQTIKENRWAYLREYLMEILEDNDGRELNDWIELHRTDLSAFRERARRYARSRNDCHNSGLWLDEEAEQQQ